MGMGCWSSRDWDYYKSSSGISHASTVDDIYKSKCINAKLNPYGINFRESRDSDEHPNSNAIIIGLDVTGSMGSLATTIAKESLNKLITEVYADNSIEDPQLLISAIGDAYYDDAPLQVTQFESDIRIAKQLTDIYFEAGGGGNNGESYLLTWYFAARHTDIDCFNKRGKKGILFTIGDEPNLDKLTKEQVKTIFGESIRKDLSAKELYAEVSKMYEVYHIVVGDYEYYNSDKKWKKLLNERCFVLKDYNKIPEVIEATLQLLAGKSIDEAVKNFSSDTASDVVNAIGDYAKLPALRNNSSDNKLVTF
ncbi:MAG: hypothetical protein K6F69_08095 [Treponema sp.]|nr:hypothetical protein [Treponema sp.]